MRLPNLISIIYTRRFYYGIFSHHRYNQWFNQALSANEKSRLQTLCNRDFQFHQAVQSFSATSAVVGYVFSDHIDSIRTAATLELAVKRKQSPGSLIFHSDRDIQYASNRYWEILANYNITQGMSRKRDPSDNAVAENFFSCLKCELVHLKHYRTRDEAQANLFVYIETFYNTVRPHSGLG